MTKKERELEMPQLLSADTIQALAENAEALKGILSSGDEAAALKNGWCNNCCCPKFLKFKFVLCNVWIINDNAECPDHKD